MMSAAVTRRGRAAGALCGAVWLQMMVIVLVVRVVIAIGDSLALPFGVDPMALPLASFVMT